MTQWSSLFWWSDQVDSCADHLISHLTEQGFTIYDPFVMGSAKVYPHTVKCFIAPKQAGCIRILIEASVPDCSSLAESLACTGDCCFAHISAKTAQCWIFPHGQPAYALDLDAPISAVPVRKVGAVAIDTLPTDLQQMAQNLPTKQIDTLYARVMRNFQAFLPAGQAFLADFPDWGSPQAQQLSHYLTERWGQGWRDPDFASIRSAMILHRQSASYALSSEDQSILSRVPDIADYKHIYAGK